MYYDDDIDYERLREDLMDYFGTAMQAFPVAMMDLTKVERASNQELVNIARQNGVDLRKYKSYER